jgi:hypothetical protein
VNQSEIWHQALCILADFSAIAYWRMTDGAEFWWTLTDRSQLRNSRFADEPFSYSEIVCIQVFDEVRTQQEVLSCDLPKIKERLLCISGLRVTTLRDLCILPATSPNMVLELTVDSDN